MLSSTKAPCIMAIVLTQKFIQQCRNRNPHKKLKKKTNSSPKASNPLLMALEAKGAAHPMPYYKKEEAQVSGASGSLLNHAGEGAEAGERDGGAKTEDVWEDASRGGKEVGGEEEKDSAPKRGKDCIPLCLYRNALLGGQ